MANNKRMEDWLKLIDAETYGDLEDLEKSTTVPEILQVIDMLREMSVDEEICEQARQREKFLNENQPDCAGSKR